MPNRRGRTREKAQTPSSSEPASTVVVLLAAEYEGAGRDRHGNGSTVAVVMSVSSSRSSEGRADKRRQCKQDANAKPLKTRAVRCKTGPDGSGLAKSRERRLARRA